jgi:hypothetical protein
VISLGGVQYDSGTATGDIVRGGTQNVFAAAVGTVLSTGFEVVYAKGTAASIPQSF